MEFENLKHNIPFSLPNSTYTNTSIAVVINLSHLTDHQRSIDHPLAMATAALKDYLYHSSLRSTCLSYKLHPCTLKCTNSVAIARGKGRGTGWRWPTGVGGEICNIVSTINIKLFFKKRMHLNRHALFSKHGVSRTPLNIETFRNVNDNKTMLSRLEIPSFSSISLDRLFARQSLNFSSFHLLCHHSIFYQQTLALNTDFPAKLEQQTHNDGV